MKNDQLPLTAQRKSVTVELKVDDEGQFEAIFSTFNVIDHDGDVTLPGAFEEGAEVIVGSYGHNTWSGALPIGKGVIKQTDKDARILGKFWLNSNSGKEHYIVAKELGAKQEWSYGYDVKGTGDVDDLPEELQAADRVLTKLEVFEVSPVLRGAGIDTQTVVVKTAPDAASFREYVKEHKEEIADAMRKAQGGDNAAAVTELARFELFRFSRLRR